MKKFYRALTIFICSYCFCQPIQAQGGPPWQDAIYNQCMAGRGMATLNPQIYQQNPQEYCQSVVAYEFQQLTNLVNNPPPCMQDIYAYLAIKNSCQEGRNSASTCRAQEQRSQSCFTAYPQLKYINW